jgi:P4 family phage/plasmid primase-like protien
MASKTTFQPYVHARKIIKAFFVKRLGHGQASQLISSIPNTGLHVIGDNPIAIKAQEGFGIGAKEYHIKEIVAAVRRNAPLMDPYGINDPGKHIIIFQNGVLDLRSLQKPDIDLRRLKLDPLYPDYFYTIGIPHRFAPKVDCPIFNRFISQVLPTNSHNLLRQIMGYMLIPSTAHRKFFIFVGEGANGKSTLIEVLVELLGRQNVSHQSLHQIAGNRFASSELYGKLANTYADLESHDIKSSGLLKQIVSGDSLQFEKKFKDPFSAPVTARLLFSANKIPIIREESKAIQDRLVILEFPNRFEEGQQDKGLIGKLTNEKEMEGIIAQWAIPGLQSLLNSGVFDMPIRSHELLNHYRKQSDPFSDFTDQRIEAVPGAYASKAGIYYNYQNWCEQCGVDANQRLNQRDFNRRIQETYNITDDEFRTPGTRERAWKGVRPKADGETSGIPG